MTDASDSAAFWNLTLAFGGKFRGMPLRFYFGTELDGDSFFVTGDRFTRQVSTVSLLFGPRIYIPVARNMRIFGEASLGMAWAGADWHINGIEHYAPRDNGMAGKYGCGFQARLSRWLSLGLVLERVVYWGRDNDLSIPAFAGLDYSAGGVAQTRFGGTVGLHF